MNKIIKAVFLIVLLFTCGCAWKAYLGSHGTSIRLHMDIHEDVYKDIQCLECHHPDVTDFEGPFSPHPNFKGCLKCHNDELSYDEGLRSSG
jgi:hypothetical protein